MKRVRGCREGMVESYPARFVILAICVMLFVIFFIFKNLITKCNIKDDNDDDIKMVLSQ